MAEHQDVLIVAELENAQLSSMTLELLGIGATISNDLKGELLLVAFGRDAVTGIKRGFGFGAHRVYAALDPLLSDYAPEAHLQAMEQIVRAVKPAVVLFGQTDRGIDLAPRLAFRMKTAAALDCVNLSVAANEGRVKYVKPVFGGKAHAVFSTDLLPLIASVRQGSFAPCGSACLRPAIGRSHAP